MNGLEQILGSEAEKEKRVAEENVFEFIAEKRGWVSERIIFRYFNVNLNSSDDDENKKVLKNFLRKLRDDGKVALFDDGKTFFFRENSNVEIRERREITEENIFNFITAGGELGVDEAELYWEFGVADFNDEENERGNLIFDLLTKLSKDKKVLWLRSGRLMVKKVQSIERKNPEKVEIAESDKKSMQVLITNVLGDDFMSFKKLNKSVLNFLKDKNPEFLKEIEVKKYNINEFIFDCITYCLDKETIIRQFITEEDPELDYVEEEFLYCNPEQAKKFNENHLMLRKFYKP